MEVHEQGTMGMRAIERHLLLNPVLNGLQLIVNFVPRTLEVRLLATDALQFCAKYISSVAARGGFCSQSYLVLDSGLWDPLGAWGTEKRPRTCQLDL